ncbi:chemotaxis protein CheC [Halomarina litorea]|uniref:chemotaxis protein CheC n=1 Tax=Halomarina litorea TaxID=2961595 RepID=UPI0020C47331|nr:chemotaxis protein CheC [Halomarina sp. BCD28]
MSNTSKPNDTKTSGRADSPTPAERTIAVESLAVMNRLGEIGIGGVERRLQQLHPEATVTSEQVAHGYARADLLEATFVGEERVGVRSRLPGAPFGSALVLFPLASANNAARLMVRDVLSEGEAPSHKMAQSAITELGGMIASGFLDAWADTFEQEIDVGAPTPIQDTEAEIVGTLIEEDEDLGIYVASRLTLPAYDITVQVYLFPRTDILIEILRRIDVERVVP